MHGDDVDFDRELDEVDLVRQHPLLHRELTRQARRLEIPLARLDGTEDDQIIERRSARRVLCHQSLLLVGVQRPQPPVSGLDRFDRPAPRRAFDFRRAHRLTVESSSASFITRARSTRSTPHSASSGVSKKYTLRPCASILALLPPRAPGPRRAAHSDLDSTSLSPDRDGRSSRHRSSSPVDAPDASRNPCPAPEGGAAT
jgi:hypothetical protein